MDFGKYLRGGSEKADRQVLAERKAAADGIVVMISGSEIVLLQAALLALVKPEHKVIGDIVLKVCEMTDGDGMIMALFQKMDAGVEEVNKALGVLRSEE